MPRIIGKQQINELVCRDSLSGENITLFYRLPTTQERVAYAASLYKRDGRTAELDGNVRVDFGAKILTGFCKGDFADEKGTIGCVPGEPDYRPDWLELIREYAGDLLTLVSLVVFEGSAALNKKPDMPPLANSSESI